MGKNSEGTNQNLPPDEPEDTDGRGGKSTVSDALEIADLIFQAEKNENLKVIKRKTRFLDTLALCFNSFTVLLSLMIAWAIITFFIHYLTTANWLEDFQVEFVTDLSKYAAIGGAFFAFGRKFTTIANIIDQLGKIEESEEE